MTDQTTKDETDLDLGALSDDEIQSMSPDQIDKYLAGALTDEAGEGKLADDASKPDTDQDGAQSATAGEEEDNGPGEPGGAASGYESLDPFAGGADSTSAEQLTDDGNEGAPDNASDQSTEADQASAADGQADSGADLTGDDDWKAKYESLKAEHDTLLGSFKASGRTVKVESPDDARRLMQMGYDYTNKMREMKPHLRLLKTLEHNDLLDPEKINFMIDLNKGNPEAMKKFLKDNKVDPIELDLEDSTDYKPTDHRPSEQQVALDEVLDKINTRETFPQTAQVITKEWDMASREVLMGQPHIIAILSDHMEAGFYDRISAKVQYERSLGRLAGLSDLDAYKAIGDAMQAQGAFGAPAGASNTSKPQSGQEPSQDLQGSTGSVKDRKRAANPTKGNAGAGNAQPSKNFLNDFSDEEIAAMGPPNL